MAAPLRRCCCRYFFHQRQMTLLTLRGVSSSNVNLQQEAVSTNITDRDSSDTGSTRVIVPKRKKRDELSILKALASTVEQEYSGPNFKYTDDPFLIPYSNLEKRSYSLAKASGKKAAHFAIENFPKGFLNNPAEPTLQAFKVNLGPQHGEETAEGLKERIELNQPLNAYQSFQTLKQAGTPVPDELVDQLLGLLCFYNSMDPPNQPLPEEQFYRREIGQDNTEAIRKSWKDNGAAEQLFAEITNKSASHYIHLLRGRAKYLQVDKTWELYEDMKEKGIALTVEAYTAVIAITPFLRERSETRWQLVQDVLQDMVVNDVMPTLSTFNVILYTISRSSRYRLSVQWAMQVINEMKASNIEPSLTSWYYVLRSVYQSEDVTSNVLWDIINYLQGKTFTLTDPTDLEFFSFAITKCYFNMKDLDLAYKIDELLNVGNNMQFVGDGFKEGIYYTYFLRILCMFEQIDKIMENYERITPHAYTPTFGVLDDLLKAIELNEGYHYLPEIWSDLVLFNYTQRTDLIESVLLIMGKKKQDAELQNMYMKIGQYIKERFEEEKSSTRLRSFMLTGPMIGNLILINVNGGQMEQAWEFFNIYQDNKISIERFPSEQSLVALAEAAIAKKDIERMLACTSLMADCAYPKLDMIVNKAKESLDLNDQHINHLDDLL